MEKYIDYVTDRMVEHTRVVTDYNREGEIELWVVLPYKNQGLSLRRAKGGFGKNGYVGDLIIASFYRYIQTHFAVPEDVYGIWEEYVEKMRKYIDSIEEN